VRVRCRKAADLVGGADHPAEQAYCQGIGLQEKLVTEFPSRPDFRHDLAQTHHNLASLLWKTRQPAPAADGYRRAIQIRQSLVDEFPYRTDYQRRLPESYSSLGLLRTAPAGLAEARNAHCPALNIWERLAAAFPKRPDYRSGLGASLHNLARVLSAEGDLAEARRLAELAIANQQAALRAKPKELQFRRFLRNHYWLLTDTLVRLGKLAEAAPRAADLARVFPGSAIDAHDATCFLARCVSLADGDAILPPGRRQELARTNGDRAVALLRAAVQNGFKNVARIKKEPALDPLRERPDFQEVLAGMSKPGTSDGR
jgi:tetratricopeptide (TPR) repeat protein